jgi:hypothetical protein
MPVTVWLKSDDTLTTFPRQGMDGHGPDIALARHADSGYDAEKYHVAVGTELSKGRGCRDTVLLEGGAPGTPEVISRMILTVQRSGIGFYNHERAIEGFVRIVCASQRLRVVHRSYCSSRTIRTLRIYTAAIQVAVICVCNGNFE